MITTEKSGHKEKLEYARNYNIGRNHLTRNAEITLCGVPLTSKTATMEIDEPDKEHTCEICYECYEGISNERFQRLVRRGQPTDQLHFL